MNFSLRQQSQRKSMIYKFMLARMTNTQRFAVSKRIFDDVLQAFVSQEDPKANSTNGGGAGGDGEESKGGDAEMPDAGGAPAT